MSLMVLAPIPLAGRAWALPFLAALVPSKRLAARQGRGHRTPTDVARQMVLQARRRRPGRDLVLVADSGFPALLLLGAMRRAGVAAVARLRPDAAPCEPAPPRPSGTIGRPRKKGARRPTLRDVLLAEATSWQGVRVTGWCGAGERCIEIVPATAVWRHAGLPVVPVRPVPVRHPERRFAPQAPLCPDPARIVAWFVRRRQVEVTVQEARARPGVKTQRQCSDRAIARTTPGLPALFSTLALLADRLPGRERRQAAAAWYAKPRPAFRDALAAVRRDHRRQQGLATSACGDPRTKPRPSLPEPGACTLCHPARTAKVEMREHAVGIGHIDGDLPLPSGQRLRDIWVRLEADSQEEDVRLDGVRQPLGDNRRPDRGRRGCKAPGSRVVATNTSMLPRANALAGAWPILPKPIIA